MCIENDYRFAKRKDVKRPCHQERSVYGNILDEELDFVGKVESLETDLAYVFSKIKVNYDAKEFSHPVQRALFIRMSGSNKMFKGLKGYKRFYSEETIKEVSDLYEQDIRNFGYEFGQ